MPRSRGHLTRFYRWNKAATLEMPNKNGPYIAELNSSSLLQLEALCITGIIYMQAGDGFSGLEYFFSFCQASGTGVTPIEPIVDLKMVL